jgi:hypothetical protein
MNLYDMNQKYADVIFLETAKAYFERVGSKQKAAAAG